MSVILFQYPVLNKCGETAAREGMAEHKGKHGSCNASCLQCEFEHLGLKQETTGIVHLALAS